MKKKAPKHCTDCHRTEVVDLKGRIRPIRLDKEGICQVCREVYAEAKADDEAKGRR